VAVSYKVTFAGVDNTERPASLTSPEQITGLDNLEINPRELYSMKAVPINGANFLFDRYPQVEVHTRYTDESNGIRMDEVFLLSKTEQTKHGIFLFATLNEPALSIRPSRAADKPDIGAADECDDEYITIRDPFLPYMVDVVANVPWALVQNVFVDLSYEDSENGIDEETSLTFSQTDSGVKSFAIHRRNPNLRRVGYKVTIMYADGRLVEIPPSFTLQPRIIVRPDMRGYKIVTIRPPQVNFATQKIKALTVETRYVDGEAGLNFNSVANFASANDQASFEFYYVIRSHTSTHKSVIHGMAKATDWQQTDKDDLTISIN
jgi:hypothetical protein